MTKLSNKPFLAFAGGVFAVVLSGAASAQSTSASPSASPSASSSMHALQETVATQLISSTSLTQMLAISNAIGFRAGGPMLVPPGARADSGQRYGMAAGGAAPMWNTWGSLSGDTFKYTNHLTNIEGKADTTNLAAGADYAVNPTMTVGLSVAADRTTGSLVNTTITGYTLAPYIGFQLNDNWSLDAIIGWGQGDLDVGATNVKPDRLFYGTNLAYTNWAGNWQLSAKLSYLYGEEKYDSTISFKNTIDQLRFGGRVGYWMDGVLPYFGLAYATDKTSTNSVGANDLGKSAFVASVGADFISIQNNLTGGIVYSSESGRGNSKRDSLMANINYRF